MSAGAGLTPISKPALFARLADARAQGITVVTPNRRLAQALLREFDAIRAADGATAWAAADILPFGAFVERLYEDALYSDGAAPVPQLLTEAQQQELWLAAIRGSEWGERLLVPAQTAADCRRAWELAQQWRIANALGRFEGNEDARAFLHWSKEYVRRCDRAGCTDGARLADVVAPLLGGSALRKPATLVAYAFDVIAPQALDFFSACAAQGIALQSCEPAAMAGAARRVVFPSARDELEAAARWARAQLEARSRAAAAAGSAAPSRLRIGIVVPDLGQRRKEVARIFSRAMHPAAALPGEPSRSLPVNITLGAPLTDYPLARAALSILEAACGELRFEQASKLVRSPFLGGAETEMALRARLDASLRESAPARITLGKLVALSAAAPELRRRLDAVFGLAKDAQGGERSPHEWARRFSGLLAAAGFPGERALDSAEFQVRAKLHETLAELAKLDRVAPRMSFVQALSSLRRLCADALFQPETADAPVQVMGVLESAGLGFDALWVTGLTDEAWPLRARPNPFIPPALQRSAGIPEASPEAALARGRRITAGWLASADEVVFSHPAMDADRVLIASPLIADVAQASPESVCAAVFPRHRDGIFAGRRLESLPDGTAPVLGNTALRGGTRIFSDQAACPFRAFARHRLAAEPLQAPAEGPDARARGLLLHELMKALWAELKDSRRLQGDCEPAIARAAQAAVALAKLEEPFAALERARLAKLAREWLSLERERAPFEVVATEDRRALKVAGLELNGRIDRLDRLESGGHALIDYKTGRPTPNEWMGERPDDPQLPLYAVCAAEDISAVAFGRLRAGEMRYMGFSLRKDAIPGVQAAKNWSELLAGWKREVEALGTAFAAGDARVDPKKGARTCSYCDLQPLCRVHERLGAMTGDAANDDG